MLQMLAERTRFSLFNLSRKTCSTSICRLSGEVCFELSDCDIEDDRIHVPIR